MVVRLNAAVVTTEALREVIEDENSYILLYELAPTS
jgi:hypothetical protein